MEQKVKFVVVGLVGLVLIFVFLFAQSFNQNQLLTREKDQLKADNAALSDKLDKFGIELRDKRRENESLKNELDKNKKNMIELQRQLDDAQKARDELSEKVRTLQAAPPQQAVSQMAPKDAEAYWADILKAKMDLEMQLDNVRSGLRTMQINNEQLQREKAALALEIEGLNRDRNDLKRQIEYNKKMMDSIAQELVRERSDKLKIQEGFAPVKNENAALTRQLNALNDKKIVLERKMAGAQDEKKELENKLAEMEGMLIERIFQINGLKTELEDIREGRAPKAAKEEKSAVELSPIVVRPQEGQDIESRPGYASGSVLTVNKDAHFVIIDSGEDAGVKVGDTFKVYRGEDNIAVIKVIKASKSVAACDIEQERKPVKVGDMFR